MCPFLEVKGVSKSFNGTKVLRSLDLSVQEGKILAILGPSGCGKSTTLRVVSGLLRQDRGEVWLDGKNIDDVPVNKRNIGFVFQNYSLFPYMTVSKNIEFGMRIRKYPKDHVRRRVKELLVLVGLEGFGSRRPTELSGGQQQRVALARALAIEPRLLLLDEPFGALDAKIRRRLRHDLKALQSQLGVTMVFVTHDQEEAFEVGYNIAVMNKGRIEQVDLPRNLYDRPSTGFVAKFIGNVNVITIPAKIEDEEEMEVMVRPEDVGISRTNGDPAQKGVDGVIESYTFLGPYIELRIGLTNKDGLSSLMPKSDFLRQGFRRGDRVKVRITSFRSFPKKGTGSRTEGRSGDDMNDSQGEG